MSAVLKGILFHQLVITAFKKGSRIDKMIVTIVAVLDRISQCRIILVYLFVLAELTADGSYSHNNELAVRACLLALVEKLHIVFYKLFFRGKVYIVKPH